MATDRYQKRREKLLRALKKADAPRLLVTNETNVSYLTGFTGDSSTLLIDADRTIFVSDTRYETQISDECPDLETVIRRLWQRCSTLGAERCSGVPPMGCSAFHRQGQRLAPQY